MNFNFFPTLLRMNFPFEIQISFFFLNKIIEKEYFFK